MSLSPFERVAETDPGAQHFKQPQQAVAGPIQKNELGIDGEVPAQAMEATQHDLALPDEGAPAAEIECLIGKKPAEPLADFIGNLVKALLGIRAQVGRHYAKGRHLPEVGIVVPMGRCPYQFPVLLHEFGTQALDAAKIHQPNGQIVGNDEVARVGIRVDHVVLVKPGEKQGVQPLGHPIASRLIGMGLQPDVQGNTRHQGGGQQGFGRQLRLQHRHANALDMQPLGKGGEISRLPAVIDLFVQPCGKLVQGRDQLIIAHHRAQQLVEQANVAVDGGADARILDLDRQEGVFQAHGTVHLPQAGCGKSLEVKMTKTSLRRLSQGIEYRFSHQCPVDRWHLVAGPGQLPANRFREKIHFQTELLGHFQGRAPQQAEPLEKGSGTVLGDLFPRRVALFNRKEWPFGIIAEHLGAGPCRRAATGQGPAERGCGQITGHRYPP
ncbi:hypothetical protein DESC_740125 [Desulfosarcina cetonica]|nr:hypothetical protein DESC_740125 [Desulfosarcina cetonica]